MQQTRLERSASGKVRTVLGNRFVEAEFHLIGFGGMHVEGDFLKHAAHIRYGHRFTDEAHDFGMCGGRDVLAFVTQFFEQLFAGPEANKFDLDIVVGSEAAELDKLAGEVDDFHGFSHIEDEDLAAAALGGALEHESYGFWDRHEVAGDIGVCDFDGAAVGDLFVEGRDDTARGAEDISEAHGHELRGMRFGRLTIRLEGLQKNFGEPFAGSHNVGGIDGFIGGDEDEPIDLIFSCQLGESGGAEGVIFDRFDRLTFHHGHVLVRCGVEEHLRGEAGEDVAHARFVADIGHLGCDTAAITGVAQLLLDLEEKEFGLFDQDEAPGIVGHDLSAELASNTATGTGDHHHLIVEQLADVIGFQAYGVSAEKVLDFDGSQLADFDLSGGELVHGRHGSEGEPGFLEHFDDFADAFGGRAGHGEDDLVKL